MSDDAEDFRNEPPRTDKELANVNWPTPLRLIYLAVLKRDREVEPVGVRIALALLLGFALGVEHRLRKLEAKARS